MASLVENPASRSYDFLKVWFRDIALAFAKCELAPGRMMVVHNRTVKGRALESTQEQEFLCVDLIGVGAWFFKLPYQLPRIAWRR